MQLKRLVSSTFQWALIRIDETTFKVDYPTKFDLDKINEFGMCTVPGSACILEFDEWKRNDPVGVPLAQIWVRFYGLPPEPLNDFLETWSLGSLIGKTLEVDMPFTRMHGIARMRVGVLDVDAVPCFLGWVYEGMRYDLRIEIEGVPMVQDADNAMGTDGGTDGGDGRQDDLMDHDQPTNQYAASGGQGQVSEAPVGKTSSVAPMTGLRGDVLDVTVPPSGTLRVDLEDEDLTPTTPGNTTRAPMSVHTAGLRFGSFGAISAPGRLWGGSGGQR